MRLEVKVVPNAKRERLVEEAGRIKVYLNAPALEGRANEALIEYLAARYQVKKNAVRIIRGAKNRNKLVEIKGK